MQAAYSVVLVSLAAATASVNSNEATVAEVPLVNPFCSGFYKALNSEKADSQTLNSIFTIEHRGQHLINILPPDHCNTTPTPLPALRGQMISIIN